MSCQLFRHLCWCLTIVSFPYRLPDVGCAGHALMPQVMPTMPAARRQWTAGARMWSNGGSAQWLWTLGEHPLSEGGDARDDADQHECRQKTQRGGQQKFHGQMCRFGLDTIALGTIQLLDDRLNSRQRRSAEAPGGFQGVTQHRATHTAGTPITDRSPGRSPRDTTMQSAHHSPDRPAQIIVDGHGDPFKRMRDRRTPSYRDRQHLQHQHDPHRGPCHCSMQDVKPAVSQMHKHEYAGRCDGKDHHLHCPAPLLEALRSLSVIPERSRALIQNMPAA